MTFSTGLAQDRCLTWFGGGFDAGARNYDDDALIYIPIVFNLLNRDSTDYLTDDEVQRQLDVLNADFSLSDSAAIPKLFKDIAADTRIRFCLAKIDGKPAIRRKTVTQSEIGLSERYYQSNQGGLDPASPGEVLNIWVLEIQNEGEIAGFASSPSEVDEARDGIVIDYRYFGVGGRALAPFDLGRTLTHEVGHWLGLLHIWGDQSSCEASDSIDDTPQQYDRYRGCPTWPQISCGSEDMYMNFMDLTDDECMSLFTKDQKDVMRTTMLTHRSGIASDVPCGMTTSVQEDLGQYRPFPNPFDASISLPSQPNSSTVICHSIAGLTVYEGSANGPINTSGWKAGIYLISLRTQDETYTFKLLKVN